MSAPPPTRAGSVDGLLEDAVPWVLCAVASLVAVVWAGGALAAVATGGRVGALSLAAAGEALIALPGHGGDPALAWPETARAELPGPAAYWVAQAIAVSLMVVVGITAWRVCQRFGREDTNALGLRGEAGFAAGRDLARIAVSGPSPGRLVVGRAGRRLVACEPQASLAVVGPTGCGKTAGFAIPALLEWVGPVIATSVKADLLAATIAHRRDRGQVWVYDPTACSGEAGSRWSPLWACRTWSGALRMAAWMAEAAQPRLDTVADGDYWYSQARKGLAPYLYAAATSDASINDLVRWVDAQEVAVVEQALRRASDAACEPSAEDDERYDRLLEAKVALVRDALLLEGSPGTASFADKPVETWPVWLVERVTDQVDAEWQQSLDEEAGLRAAADAQAPLVAARALWSKEPRLRGSVFATMENVLAGWADPGVGAAAHAAETELVDLEHLDLDRWLSGDNTLYLVATAHEQARLRPVLTVLVQQAIRAAYDTATSKGGRLADPCLVLLDEAGNIAPLRDLPGYASTARSHGITLVTVWQDLAQVRAAYRDRAQTVLNNHRAKLFGTGIADESTLEYVSRLIGDEHRTERNVSADLKGGRTSVSEHRTYRRAAPVDVLRRIRPGEAVLLYGSELPVHLRLRPWFSDPALRRTAGCPDLIVDDRRSNARLRR